jgi:DNA-binding transcriptional LysR family regulator
MRDLNDLVFFAAVVQHRGFSAAARALGVPKSRISRRVAILEGQLGVRLLERSTRQFHVTEVGEEVYRHARAAIVEAEIVDEIASRVLAQPRGLVRIGCPLAVQETIAPALAAFMATHPLLRVQFLLTNRRIDLVEEGVDIAIRVRQRMDADPDLQMRRIGTSRGILVASPALLDGFGRPQVPAEIARLPTLDSSERNGPTTWELHGKDGEIERISHEPRLSIDDFNVLRRLARAGVGVALLPLALCEEGLADGTLERLLPDWGTSEGIAHLVFTSRRGLLPGVRAVIDFLVDTLRSAVRAPVPQEGGDAR